MALRNKYVEWKGSLEGLSEAELKQRIMLLQKENQTLNSIIRTLQIINTHLCTGIQLANTSLADIRNCPINSCEDFEIMNEMRECNTVL